MPEIPAARAIRRGTSRTTGEAAISARPRVTRTAHGEAILRAMAGIPTGAGTGNTVRITATAITTTVTGTVFRPRKRYAPARTPWPSRRRGGSALQTSTFTGRGSTTGPAGTIG